MFDEGHLDKVAFIPHLVSNVYVAFCTRVHVSSRATDEHILDGWQKAYSTKSTMGCGLGYTPAIGFWSPVDFCPAETGGDVSTTHGRQKCRNLCTGPARGYVSLQSGCTAALQGEQVCRGRGYVISTERPSNWTEKEHWIPDGERCRRGED